jgi:hypothetical protein
VKNKKRNDVQDQQGPPLRLEEELRERICRKCDFYKEDEEELECHAFKVSKKLVKEGKLGLDEL